jgi:hypothetical protein
MPIPPDFHVTQRNMLHYWGPELELMPMRAFTLIRARSTIEVKSPWGKNLCIDTCEVQGCALGVVPYSGAGQYGSQDSELLHWSCIPPGKDQDDDLLNVKDYQLQKHGTGQQTFWPVVIVQLSPRAIAIVGEKMIVIICIYQLCGEVFYCWLIMPAAMFQW